MRIQDRTYTSFIRKAHPWEIKDVSERERSVEAIISAESKDRLGDIIRQAGWQLKHYMKNPVVLWAHDYSQPPIGVATSMEVINPQADKKAVSKKVGAYLKSVTRFAETDKGEEVFQLFLQDILRAFSVGFIPLETEKLYDGEGDEKKFTGFEFKRSELLEYSVVPVPAHQDALALAVEQGLIVKTMPDFQKFVPEMYAKVISHSAQHPPTPAGGTSDEPAAKPETVIHIDESSSEKLQESLDHLNDLLR